VGQGPQKKGEYKRLIANIVIAVCSFLVVILAIVDFSLYRAHRKKVTSGQAATTTPLATKTSTDSREETVSTLPPESIPKKRKEKVVKKPPVSWI
jgi:hypothetical protein